MKGENGLDLLDGSHALLRRESFGGTLYFVQNGKRTYVNREEFALIKASGSIPSALANELKSATAPVIVVEPAQLPERNFSAPDTVFLEATRACNLTCTHCFNSSGKELPGQLTQSQLEAIVNDLAASGVQEIRFTGGEPVILPGIVSLIKRASSLGIRCSMGTNAVLINDRKADELKAAGLHAVIVSLDGLEERHNLIRGRSSFRLTLEGLECLRARSIDIRVNIVVMRSNLTDIPPLVTSLTEQDIPVFMRRFILAGRASSTTNEMLSAAEYADLRTAIESLLDDPRAIVSGHYLKEKHITTRIPLPFARKECSAGHRGLVVLSDGRIQTCGFLEPLGEMSIGRLPADLLCDIWKRLNDSIHIPTLERNIGPYNNSTTGPRTNCLAIALFGKEPLAQIPRHPIREVSS